MFSRHLRKVRTTATAREAIKVGAGVSGGELVEASGCPALRCCQPLDLDKTGVLAKPVGTGPPQAIADEISHLETEPENFS